MGRTVNIVTSDGRVIAVPEEVAAAANADRATPMDEASVGTLNEERSSGVLEGLKATAEGALDTATLGGYGAVREELDPHGARTMRIRGQERSGARLAGELASVVAPLGLLGKGAKAVTSLTGPGIAAKLGRAGGAGLVAEGAILSAGAHVAGSNISGDHLTIAGVVEDATVGGFLNYGIAKLGEKVIGVGDRAKAAVAREKATKTNLVVAAEGEGKFAASEGAYATFRQTNEEFAKSTASHNRVAASEAAAREKALNAGSIRQAVKKAREARSQVQAELAGTPAGRHVKSINRKNAAAERQFTADHEKYEAFARDTEKVNKAFTDVDAVIDDLSARPGGAVDESDDLLSALRGTKAQLDGGAALGDVAPTGAPPRGLGERLREFKRRRSEASQKLGSWDGNAKKWTKLEGKTADVDAALEELRALREDIAAQFPSGRGKKLPDIPARPVRPEPLSDAPLLTDEDAATVRHLADLSRDLDDATKAAESLSKNGRYDLAAGELEALEARVASAGRGDLVFHRFPPPPRAPMEPGVAGLPKSIDEFARMTDEKVSRLADSMAKLPPDHESWQAFNKLRADLDTKGTSITDVHADLRRYSKALDDHQSAAAMKAAKSGDDSLLGKLGGWGKRGVASGLGRTVDVGGAKGAFARSVVMGGAVSLMTGVEEGIVGGALLGARSSIRKQVLSLAAAHAGKLGRAMGKAAPVTSYLKAAWPSGEEDSEADLRTQAHNRIGDILKAAQVAPDAAYLAIENLLGHPGDDIGFKLHQSIVGAVTHLAAMAPKDPGIDVGLRGSNWRPSAEQSIAFAHRIEAVEDPLVAIARTISGDGHPAAAETLWAVHGPIMQEFAEEFVASDHTDLTYEAEARMAQLLRLDIGLRRPEVLTMLQGMYLPQPEQTAGQQGTGGAPGRPAAVQSPVAGSSVPALTA